MINDFDIKNFSYEIICENECRDAKAEFRISDKSMDVYLTAEADRPEFINMKWNCTSAHDIYVLGDTWERSYADLGFRKISDEKRYLPWYFAATDQKETFCFGVMTQPNAFVCFTCDESGITAKIDCRNGGCGVHLKGRKIKLCTFIYENYALSPFGSLKKFCRKMCPEPILPKEKIYGGNNWYYAYGESSHDEMISDTKLQAKLAEGIENRPFMVIDDGWEINPVKGPFEPNEKYGDMKKLCSEMKELGVRPGIWIRFLDNPSPEIPDEMRILRDGKRYYLDPTNEKVKSYIAGEIEKIKGWGYELLKHDFSTCDLFGDWGKDLDDTITKKENWHFEDQTKTNAEVVLDFYRLIREKCGDMLVIGCNTISHLCAGLVEINRTGDDTSGREWSRTKRMGINTLAFRLCQNGAFYLCDADCVGILNDNIPWEKNRQWLELLSLSDTALFISCASLKENEAEDVKKAYMEIQKPHSMEPIDIYDNLTPSEWLVNGEKITFEW